MRIVLGVWLIQKGNKYLKGSTYATGVGTKYRWTKAREEAEKFEDEAYAISVAHQTRGKRVWCGTDITH